MKKYAYLGTDESGEYGCVLLSLLSYDQLIPEELETSDFIHAPSNWGGRDKVSRIVDNEGVEFSGRAISVPDGLMFTGEDGDNGFTSWWRFKVTDIKEVIITNEWYASRYNVYR